MMKRIILTLSLISFMPALHAEAKPFECEILAVKLVDQLVEEGLLLSAEQYQQYARKLTITTCMKLQKSAQAQDKKADTQPTSTQPLPKVVPANKGSRRPR